jgi:hypothetical protein
MTRRIDRQTITLDKQISSILRINSYFIWQIEYILTKLYDNRNNRRRRRLQKFQGKTNESRRKIKDPDAIAAIKKGLKVTDYKGHQVIS